MPNIESFLDRELGLTVITVCGEIKPPEIPKCIDHYYKGNRNNMALFDFSNASLAGADPAVPMMALPPKKRISRKGDRKAFVFPHNIDKDLKPFLMEYCRIAETGSNLDVFASVVDANRWLVKGQEEHRRPKSPPEANH